MSGVSVRVRGVAIATAKEKRLDGWTNFHWANDGLVLLGCAPDGTPFAMGEIIARTGRPKQDDVRTSLAVTRVDILGPTGHCIAQVFPSTVGEAYATVPGVVAGLGGQWRPGAQGMDLWAKSGGGWRAGAPRRLGEKALDILDTLFKLGPSLAREVLADTGWDDGVGATLSNLCRRGLAARDQTELGPCRWSITAAGLTRLERGW